MIENIGMNAGKVWAILDEEGNMSERTLKKAVNLTFKDLYAALGWLAREEKINLEKKGRDIYISLC
ncbi:MAG TPA: winged helix-turn-helix domain-containing protein [Dysgonamonadaceae bacterium]|nr:winged helix-turn-helix domain-containing protein [Dysgonamonadaceae bacterium]